MKKYRGIRYAFRPKSYWADTTVEQAILRGVKGTRRRALLAQALKEGQLERVGDELQSAEVTDAVREQLGRIHPSLMGGEYLPGYQREETEIARVELESTTSDVISIRARWEEGRIYYRVVDEYNTEFRCHPETSDRPFNLGEFIQFIDGISCSDLCGSFSTAYNELNLEGGSERRSLRHFTSISSDIYHHLWNHFEKVFEEWAADGEEDLEEDDE
jgi:hypothetical protein